LNNINKVDLEDFGSDISTSIFREGDSILVMTASGASFLAYS
jgi:hypothetical protein